MGTIPETSCVKEENAQHRLFRFGMFEFDSGAGELRKEGKSCPRIRDQALRILVMLVEKPGDLVTREELRERIWSADTYVDFDHGLNTAINQLRNALGDSATSPRFIQTLPRRGYRFIAPVQVVTEKAPASPGENAQRSIADAPTPPGHRDQPLPQTVHSSVLSDVYDLPVVPRPIVRTLFSLIQIMYLIFYIMSLARLSEVETILTASGDRSAVLFVLLIVTAAIGIPVRLYLLAAAAFNYLGLSSKFQKLFPFLLPLDELWALTPFLLVQQLGIGLAIAFTAAILYLPFSQRSLLLMGSKPCKV